MIAVGFACLCSLWTMLFRKSARTPRPLSPSSSLCVPIALSIQFAARCSADRLSSLCQVVGRKQFNAQLQKYEGKEAMRAKELEKLIAQSTKTR